ncbi:hypothetical protein Pcinc_013191 [Petrolisthes cinctipes]|uniref:EF-hand domain-containing protein n=1 Tax=Petrolisthes cinctipes TaxID=88211 RepID=A0AAE1FXD4_PETCI|nr:hypothetical protein Pcinc_013191 [Petrolisthes cinctipes]
MQGNNGVSSGPQLHHAYEHPIEEEERLGALFNKLDRDGDGRINIHDLSEGLKKLNLPANYAELLIQKADVNQSNDLSLAEFVNYVQEHEKRLLLVFHTLDANSDGRVDERELMSSFKRLGVHIDHDEAKRLLQR